MEELRALSTDGRKEQEKRREVRIAAFKKWINEICAANSVDYTSLARKAGLSPSTITRPINSESYSGDISGRSIAAIVSAFGNKPPKELRDFELYSSENDLLARRIDNRAAAQFLDHKTNVVSENDAFRQGLLPIYGRRMLGIGPLLFTGQIGATPVLPELLNSFEAFAVYCLGQPMAPAIREGSLLYADPAAPVRSGDFVVVRWQEDEILIREYVGASAAHIILRSYGDQDDAHLTLERGTVQSMARITHIRLP